MARLIVTSIATIAIALYFVITGVNDDRPLYVAVGVLLLLALAWENNRTRRRGAGRRDD